MFQSSFYIDVAIDTPLMRTFTYLPPLDAAREVCQPGCRVLVPFGKRNVVGVILSTLEESQVDPGRLKEIITVLDAEPIWPTDVLELLKWTAEYYHHPAGEVFVGLLPVGLRQPPKKPRKPKKIASENSRTIQTKLTLNAEQAHAVQTITQAHASFNTFLLEGITGSGKTEVYLQAIDAILEKDQQALILVPEISLTPQVIERFTERFNVPIVALHSRLSENERVAGWQRAACNEAKLVIGTRSAIFTPMPTLGIIVIDEEHDLSYKQQEGLRYSARDIAIRRAQLLKIPVVLGSATPALESLYNVSTNRYAHLPLLKRATEAILPEYRIVDLRNKRLEEGLSSTLMDQIRLHVAAGNQVLLFINRRGYAPLLTCHHCGWKSSCERCDAYLTLHYDPYHLRCHHCDTCYTVESLCPHCQQTSLLAMGSGTERIEQTLQKYFDADRICRIDRDTTQRKGSLQQLLTDIHSGQHQILIGTQMLAKGHHFPNVTLVGILDVDAGLFSGDFRASERMGQLITQVAGRAGRAHKPGEVIIQTHHPDHATLRLLLEKGYKPYAEQLLREREITKLPPYGYMALFRAEAHLKADALEFLSTIKLIMQDEQSPIKIWGPLPALMEKRAGRYRAQLLLRSERRSDLYALLKKTKTKIHTHQKARKVRWSLDIDPQDLM